MTEETYADQAEYALGTVTDEVARMLRQGKPDDLTEMEIGTAQIQALTGIGYAILAVAEILDRAHPRVA